MRFNKTLSTQSLLHSHAECRMSVGIYTISSLTHSLYLVLQKPSLLIYAKRKTISHICTKPYFLLENQRNVVYSFTFCYRARLRVDGSRYITSFIYVLFILLSTTKTTCKQICQDFSYETCMFYCKSFWHADKSFFFFASYRPGRWSSRRMLRKRFCGCMCHLISTKWTMRGAKLLCGYI